MSNNKSEIDDNSINDENQTAQNCPICLCNLNINKVVSSPDVCQHIFCLDCLKEWSKKINTCPIDRKIYNYILVKKFKTLSIIKRIKVEDRVNKAQEEFENDLTYCEVCNQANREDRMLLCDSCDKGYHCECLNPAIDEIPEGQWFCPTCANTNLTRLQQTPTTSRNSEISLVNTRRVSNVNRRTRNIAHLTDTTFITRLKKTIKKRVKKRRKKRRIKKITGKQLKNRLSNFKKIESNKKYEKLKPEPVKPRKRRVTKKRKSKRKQKKYKRKYNLGSILKKNALNIKKKYRLTNKTPKERILKRIIDHNEKSKSLSSNNSIKLDDPLINEDLVAVQLTSQTSLYLNNSLNCNLSKNNSNLKLHEQCTSSNLLDSILSKQKILITDASKLKVNLNGTIEINNHSDLNSIANKQQNRLLENEKKILVKDSNSNLEIKKDFKEAQSIVNCTQQSKSENINNNNQSTDLNKLKIKNETIESPIIKNDSIQEEIASICKQALKSFYLNKTINKDEYKMIMKRVVNKSKIYLKDKKIINPKKVTDLALAYVKKISNEKKLSADNQYNMSNILINCEKFDKSNDS